MIPELIIRSSSVRARPAPPPKAIANEVRSIHQQINSKPLR